MRHRLAGRHLGRDSAHRRALYRNLVTDFLRYERITTTEAKAKEIRPMAEKIITLAKRGDLHARRLAGRFLYDPIVVRRAFDVIAPRMASRPGGYTRITSLEPRKGDGARMAVLELVDVVDVAMPRPQRATAAPTASPSRAAVAAPATPETPEVEVPSGDTPSEPPTDVGAAEGDEAGAAITVPEAEASVEGEEQAPGDESPETDERDSGEEPKE